MKTKNEKTSVQKFYGGNNEQCSVDYSDSKFSAIHAYIIVFNHYYITSLNFCKFVLEKLVFLLTLDLLNIYLYTYIPSLGKSWTGYKHHWCCCCDARHYDMGTADVQPPYISSLGTLSFCY